MSKFEISQIHEMDGCSIRNATGNFHVGKRDNCPPPLAVEDDKSGIYRGYSLHGGSAM